MRYWISPVLMRSAFSFIMPSSRIASRARSALSISQIDVALSQRKKYAGKVAPDQVLLPHCRAGWVTVAVWHR